MFKRARISLEIASIAAIFGFTGIIDGTEVVAQAVFYGLIAFALLSSLFGLFEAETPAGFSIENSPSPVPSPAPSFSALEAQRVSVQ